jgi:putative phosphoesterase
MTIGVISDTHGLLDPKVASHFEGVDHILHAGDIGPLSLLHALEQMAPVTAVLGNTDSPLPGIRETEFIRLGPVGFLVHHIVDPLRPSETLQRRLQLNQPDVVIFGHTHKPFSERFHNILFFNPGSAGPQRFNLRRSLALFHLESAPGPTGAPRIRDELIWL